MNILSALEAPAAPIAEVQHLLSFERRASRLLCLYLADLADRLQSSDCNPLPERHLHATARRFDLGLRDARERVRIGRALRRLPQIEAAFVAGELSYSRVREITRVASPETEATWLELARRLDMRTLEGRVASGQPTPPASPPASARPQPLQQPPLRMTFELTPSAWSLLQRALEQTRRRSSAPLSDAEALEIIARSILATPRPDPDLPTRPAARPSNDSPTSAPPLEPPTASASTEAIQPSESAAPVHLDGTSAPNPPAVESAALGPAAVESAAVESAALEPSAIEASAIQIAAATPAHAEPVKDNAARLLQVIRTQQDTSLDDLIHQTGLTIAELQHTLLLLELQGHIQNASGRIAPAQP